MFHTESMMLSFEHGQQYYEFYGSGCLKHYARSIIECTTSTETLKTADPLAYTFFMTLLRRHPNSPTLSQRVRDLTISSNKLFILSQESSKITFPLQECYSGHALGTLLEAMRNAVQDASLLLCYAFLERTRIDEPIQFSVDSDSCVSFRYKEDREFVEAWRSYHQDRMDWASSADWKHHHTGNQKTQMYSRFVGENKLVITKKQNEWVFIYNNKSVDAVICTSFDEAMQVSYDYVNR